MNQSKINAIQEMALHSGFNLPFALLDRLPAEEAVVYQFLLNRNNFVNINGWIPLPSDAITKYFPKDSSLEILDKLIDKGLIERDKLLYASEDGKPLKRVTCYKILKVMSPYAEGWTGGWKQVEYEESF